MRRVCECVFKLGMQFHVALHILFTSHILFVQYADHMPDQINAFVFGKAHNGISRVSRIEPVQLVFLDVRLIAGS